ncbi:MAG: hypothetical protein AAF564_09925 [Bacteroidota bacterium]
MLRFKAIMKVRHLVVALLFAGLFAGCEEDPNPLIGEDQPFTVYGFFNPKANRQLVRVIPVANVIDQVGVGADQATVRSIDVASGDVRVWKDSLVTFSDESTGIVFFSDFTPEHEAAYRLEVIRNDGATSSVEVTVPRDITIRREPGTNPLIPEFILEGELPNFVQVAVKYRTAALQPQKPVVLEPVQFPVNVSYKGLEERAGDDWRYRIDYREDLAQIREAFSNACLTTEYIAVRSIQLEFFVGDNAWVPPGGEFDPELLVQPQLFSNIENGFGYFGAGYVVDFNVLPTTPILQTVGFIFDPPCTDMTPLTDPSCQLFEGCFDGVM